MFRHILVPTDGSALSRRAIRTAVALAKAHRASLTGLHVMPPYAPPMYGEAAVYVPEVTQKRWEEVMRGEADKALAVLEKEARAAGVGAKRLAIAHDSPWQAIIRTAKSKKCDLIVMASHGRRGLAGLVLGSETHKVLTHSKIPVLVCR
jgi:nucleotide-binding universal stress UspA family protein